jgi:hypothetical protein
VRYARIVIPFLPKRFLERGWRSMLYEDNLRDPQTRAVNEHMLEQMYLGLRYFRRRLMWENYTQNQPLVLPDDELRSIEVPTLLPRRSSRSRSASCGRSGRQSLHGKIL